MDRASGEYEQQMVALKEWQMDNTTIYYHVRPSLNIDGVHFYRDVPRKLTHYTLDNLQMAGSW